MTTSRTPLYVSATDAAAGRRLRSLAVAALAAITLAGCASATEGDEQPMAAAVTIGDQWASSGHMGMGAVFGTLTNIGHHEARIVSATSPAAGRVELHEVVSDETATNTMRPKAGGVTVPANGSHALAPGGDHIMLIDLTGPLDPGADVTLSLQFEDGSTLPLTAQVRDFAGANEQYEPAAASGSTTPPHGHG